MASTEHDFLLNLGKAMALAFGYRQDEIHPEYTLRLRDHLGQDKSFVVDLFCCPASAIGTRFQPEVGLVIECGSCDAEKLQILRQNYPFRVLHLPFSFGDAFHITIDTEHFLPQHSGSQGIAKGTDHGWFRFAKLIELFEEISAKHDGLAPISEMIDRAEEVGIGKDEVMEFINESRRRGNLYEPKYGCLARA